MAVLGNFVRFPSYLTTKSLKFLMVLVSSWGRDLQLGKETYCWEKDNKYYSILPWTREYNFWPCSSNSGPPLSVFFVFFFNFSFSFGLCCSFDLLFKVLQQSRKKKKEEKNTYIYVASLVKRLQQKVLVYYVFFSFSL